MKTNASRIIFGIALILLGVLFFLQSIFHIKIGELVVAAFFILGGGVFFYVYFNNNEHWWALIPGFTLVGIGGLIGMGTLFPRLAELYGGSFFLAMIGLSFLVIYLIHRDYWWAVIPAGVLFTLAFVAGIAQFGGGISGAAFFLGLAITFGVLGLMQVGQKNKWPWIPAGICAGLALIVALSSGIFNIPFFAYVIPSILLVVGIYLIVRSMHRE